MEQNQNVLQKTSPKDFFLHLLSMVALYVSGASFLVLVFNYTDLTLPDIIQYYSLAGARSAIRWSIASLIVVFPAYLWSIRFLNKQYAETPEKRNLRARKWLVYFTLFLAAIIIGGDIITLLYNFLEGELTTRFLIKVAAVFFVAAAVFYYYFSDIRQNISPRRLKIFAITICAAILASVILGFTQAGSPAKERLRRLDQQRVEALQSLQMEIVNYWQRKDAVPPTLSALRNDISGFIVPKDPANKAEYKYEKRGDKEFILCAIFALPSEETAMGVRYDMNAMENWQHAAGEVCFDRTIDEDLYKLTPAGARL